MKLKVLALGTGALVVLAAGALGVNWWQQRPRTHKHVGQPLMPAIDMTKAARIQITGNDGEVTLLSGPDGLWHVKQQDGFVADHKKLSSFMVKLSGDTIDQKVTDRKEKLGDLGLLTAKENGGKRVENKTATSFDVLDSADKPLYQILIGKNRQGMGSTSFGGQYVRFPSSTAAYLVSQSLFLSTKPEDWIDKVIFDVDADKTLKSMRIEKPGKRPLVFTRDKAGAPWTLQGLGKDKLNEKEVKSLASSLAGLDVVKVAPPNLDAKALGRTHTGTVKVEFFDKRDYTISIGTSKGQGDFRYLTVSAALDGSVKDSALRKSVADFNARYKGHRMAVYDYDGGRLLRERKDFIATAKKKAKK